MGLLFLYRLVGNLKDIVYFLLLFGDLLEGSLIFLTSYSFKDSMHLRGKGIQIDKPFSFLHIQDSSLVGSIGLEPTTSTMSRLPPCGRDPWNTSSQKQ